MTDWDDRIIDSALQELGGQQPPDLSARILIALGEEAPGQLPVLQSRPRTFAGPAMLAAAFLCLGMLTAYVVSYTFDDGPKVAVDAERVALHVVSGEVEFVPANAQRPGEVIAAGNAAIVSAHRGARMFVSTDSRLRLGVFPTLQVQPATQLEVRSMGFSMKNGVVAATSLTIGVVVGVVSWDALSGPEVRASGEVVHLESEALDTTDYSAENARLLTRLQSLEADNARLMTVREGVASQAAVEESAPDEVLPEPEVATALMFEDARFADVLSKINWAAMGKATFEMQPLMTELVRAFEEDGEVSTDIAVQIQNLNTHLLGEVPTMMEAGLPGTGPNGAYTHPLVVSNTLASTLNAAGQPLDEAQSAALAGLVRSFTAELDGVAAGQYEFESETMMHELEAKDRFYEEMSQRLTPEQFAAIYPKGSTDFDGLSLFGTGLVTRGLLRPIKAANAADFGRRAGNKMADALGFNDADTMRLRTVLESVSASSADMWGKPASAVESKLKFLRAGRTKAALRNQVAMLRAVSRQFQLTSKQRKKLFSMQGVLVPLYN
ncbi:MAG: hypothetical protein ACI85K_002692 [Hyphomicrobiaceae bacterium]|jgi:hypothetical protein